MTTLIAFPDVDGLRAEPHANPPPRGTEARPGAVARGRRPEAEAIRSLEAAQLEDYRMRDTAFAVIPREEEVIDATLAQSFPASDPPPWTLGVDHARETAPEATAAGCGGLSVSDSSAGRPTWRDGIMSLVEASAVVALFALAILLAGSVVALGVRLVLEALIAAAAWLS